MGDMADYLTEQGEGAWLAHLDGDCPLGCRHCEREEQAMRKAKRASRAPGGAAGGEPGR